MSNAARRNFGSFLQLVGKIVQEEGVSPTPERFAGLVALAYEDSAAGSASEDRLRHVVQLLR